MLEAKKRGEFNTQIMQIPKAKRKKRQKNRKEWGISFKIPNSKLNRTGTKADQ